MSLRKKDTDELTVYLDEVSERYHNALDSFIDKLRDDVNVIAVVIEGSLAYDKVWEKSDIDMMVVIRDQSVNEYSYPIEEDGIQLNADLITRTRFRKILQAARGGGWMHSQIARGKVVFTKDKEIEHLFDDMRNMGIDDIERSFLVSVSGLLGSIEKVEKWLTVLENTDYARFFLLKLSDGFAALELTRRGIPFNRESVLTLQKLDPELIYDYYTRPLEGPMTKDEIQTAVDKLYAYLDGYIDMMRRPVIEHMRDGEVRTLTMLAKHFGSDAHSLGHVLDFLAERGIVERVTETIRITPKGRKIFEEKAYVYVNDLL